MKKILSATIFLFFIISYFSLRTPDVFASATVVDDKDDFSMSANAGLTFHLQGKSGLIALSEFVNASNTNANATAGNFFVLLPDDTELNSIELSGVSIIPIGRNEDGYLFRGNFDGSGVIINNLTINSGVNGVGLFGATDQSLIENIILSGITTVQSTDSNAINVGTIIGYAQNQSVISGVRLYGNVEVVAQGSAGGLVGYINEVAAATNVVLNSQINTNQLIVRGTGTGIGGRFIGGLIGRFLANVNNRASIDSSSINSNSVVVNGNEERVGGFIGWLDEGRITSSYINTNLLEIKGDRYVSGFAGEVNQGIIEKSFLKSNILTLSGNLQLGGFAGEINNIAKIEHTYVSLNHFIIETTNTNNYVGGFVGRITNNTIVNSSYLSSSGITFNNAPNPGLFVGRTEFVSTVFNNLQNTFVAIKSYSPSNMSYIGNRDSDTRILNSYYNSGLSGNAWIDASTSSPASPVNLATVSGSTLLDILNTGSTNFILNGSNSIYEPTISDVDGQEVSLIQWSSLFANTITYSGLLGGSNGGNPTSYVASDSNIVLASGVRDGYEFLGWFENPDLVTSGITEIDTSAGINYTLYAKWSSPIDYTVTFNLNDTVDFSATSGANPASYNVESSTITLVSGIRDYYTFEGWYENPDLVTSGITEISTGSFGNKTLYAKWNPVTYTVTFDENNGVALSNLTYTVDSGTVTLPTTTRTGHTFSSWTLNGTPLANNVLPIRSQDVTVEAVWQVNQYTLTFDTDGGSIINALTQDYDSAITPPPNPTKPGVRFTRWDPIIPSTMPANNLTLTAIYTTPITTSGAITAPGIYYIEDESGLIALREKVNAGSGLSGYTFVLLNNIDLVEPWIPIGNISQRPFMGTFNGNGYIISNINITGTETGIGFFGNLNGANINNLILENIIINAFNRQNVGSVSGSNTSSTTISGVQVRGNISIIANVKVGGFVGVNNGSTITHSSIDATSLSMIGSGTVEATQFGGFVGHNVNAEINQSFIQVDSLLMNQKISANSSPNSRYGGFVGFNQTNASLTNSYLKAKLISIFADSNMGALIGSNEVSSVRSSMVASKSTLLSGLTNVGQLIGINNSNTNGVHDVVMIIDQSVMDRNIIGFINGSATIENIYFNSGLVDASWYSFDGATSTLENTPLSDINGTAILNLINQSGVYALPSPTNSTFYIPVLSTSATAFAERQANEVVYWLELPAPPPPPPVQSTPPPAPSTPSPAPGTSSTPQVNTTEVRVTPLVKTLHLAIDSGVRVFDVFQDIKLPSAIVELQFGYVRTILEDVLTITHEINQQVPGQYVVVYEAKYDDLVVTEEIVITVVDRVAPIITGPQKQSILRGEIWESGITVQDNVDSNPIVTLPRVNVTIPGTYDLEIRSIDASGNESVFIQTLEVLAPRTMLLTAEIDNQSFVFVVQEPNYDLDRGQLQTSLDRQTWQTYDEDAAYDMTQIIYLRYFDGTTSSEIKQTVPIFVPQIFIPSISSTYVQLTTSLGIILLVAIVVLEFALAFIGYILIYPDLEDDEEISELPPTKQRNPRKTSTI